VTWWTCRVRVRGRVRGDFAFPSGHQKFGDRNDRDRDRDRDRARTRPRPRTHICIYIGTSTRSRK
jgi:hypothetical protein